MAVQRTNIPGEWLLAGGAIFALTVGLAFSEFSRFRQGELLRGEVTAARADADAALKAVIVPEALESVESSVYLAFQYQSRQARRPGWGTAFVIDQEQGVLATAGHVAAGLDVNDKKFPVQIMNRFTGKPVKVYAKRMHAGYGALTRVAEEIQPIDPQSLISNPRIVPLGDLANDAGVLFVEPRDPETGDYVLGPSLPLAPKQKLAAMKPGEPIAIVSYPGDMIDESLAAKSGAARADRGTVANLISPIDVADDGKDKDARTLIIHRMAITYGSSGAPVFNRDMEVVGITSHKMPPAGDGVAQRADVIHDLLGSLQEERAVATVYEPQWRARLGQFVSARDAIPLSLYRASSPEDFDEEETFAGVDFSQKPPYNKQLFDIEFGQTVETYFHYAPDLVPAASIDSPQGARRSSTQIGLSKEPVFAIQRTGQYAVQPDREAIVLEPGKRHILFVFDYAVSNSVEIPGYCRVRLFWRGFGEDALNQTPLGMIAQVEFEPSDKERQIDVLYNRTCAGPSPAALAGLISWSDKAAVAPATASAEARPVLAAVKEDRARDVFRKIRNFAECNLAFGQEDSCTAPIKVRHVSE
ncbi:MAG: trypsin-like peptidase domain-containing protein [Parvularculaceae bacterium]|nr:trypsin-like peptidase domain-containing protein [Parvularculaceae bacterium]